MTNVVTPMSIEDAICYESFMGCAAFLGIIAGIILWSLVAIVVGSVVFFIAIIVCLAKKNYGGAILAAIAWVICASITYGLHNWYWDYQGRENAFKNKIATYNELPKCYQSSTDSHVSMGYIFELKDGTIIWSQSVRNASRGNCKIITEDGKRAIFEKVLKTKINQSVYATGNFNRWAMSEAECNRLNINKTVLKCRLSKDLNTLTVIVEPRWRNFDTNLKRVFIHLVQGTLSAKFWQGVRMLGRLKFATREAACLPPVIMNRMRMLLMTSKSITISLIPIV